MCPSCLHAAHMHPKLNLAVVEALQWRLSCSCVQDDQGGGEKGHRCRQEGQRGRQQAIRLTWAVRTRAALPLAAACSCLARSRYTVADITCHAPDDQQCACTLCSSTCSRWQQEHDPSALYARRTQARHVKYRQWKEAHPADMMARAWPWTHLAACEGAPRYSSVCGCLLYDDSARKRAACPVMSISMASLTTCREKRRASALAAGSSGMPVAPLGGAMHTWAPAA